jgi:hypothetical protein
MKAILFEGEIDTSIYQGKVRGVAELLHAVVDLEIQHDEIVGFFFPTKCPANDDEFVDAIESLIFEKTGQDVQLVRCELGMQTFTSAWFENLWDIFDEIPLPSLPEEVVADWSLLSRDE